MTPRPQIAAEYSFDLDRTLRGLLILCGVSKEEIEARLKARRIERESEANEHAAS